MAGSPSIKDVAAHARRLRSARSATSSTGPSVVAERTRQRVLAAIAELGFVRNESARQLRGGAQPHARPTSCSTPRNPFFTDVARACEEAADAAGARGLPLQQRARTRGREAALPRPPERAAGRRACSSRRSTGARPAARAAAPAAAPRSCWSTGRRPRDRCSVCRRRRRGRRPRRRRTCSSGATGGSRSSAARRRSPQVTDRPPGCTARPGRGGLDAERPRGARDRRAHRRRGPAGGRAPRRAARRAAGRPPCSAPTTCSPSGCCRR